MNLKRILGKPVIHPILFYANKATAIYFLLLFLGNFFPILGLGDLLFFAFKIILLLLVVLAFLQLPENFMGNFSLFSNLSSLKTGGLFSFTRNPFSTLMNIVIIITLKNYLSSFWVLGLATYVIITHHLIILKEEESLKEKWGEQYEKYIRKVKRYGFF